MSTYAWAVEVSAEEAAKGPDEEPSTGDERRLVIECYADEEAQHAIHAKAATYTLTGQHVVWLTRRMGDALTADELEHFERCVRIAVERAEVNLRFAEASEAMRVWARRCHGREG